MAQPSNINSVRYEPDENPPLLITLGAGVQASLSIIGGVVLGVLIVFRIAGQPDSSLAWAVFAALLISGITTIIQAVRIWRIGAGHLLMMGTSGAFIAVCAAALMEGGPALMASLVVVSALFQFALSARLSWLRRIFTPVITGTVIMLIAATIMPILFDMLTDVPEHVAPSGAPIVALISVAVVAALVLRAPPMVRIWSPLIGIIIGCVASVPFGMYDFQYVIDAPWFGIAFRSWPGWDLTPGVEFWALLPAFVVVTLVGAIETIGDGVAIQRVSRRRPRATDFRVVQGALNADGVGNFLSGIAGTVPNTTYSSSVALAEVTGIASRRVGIAVGIIFIAIAFFPKISALLIAIPAPVLAGYGAVLITLLFVQGMNIVIRDGLDHRKAAIVGLGFWIGVGFQNQVIFPNLLGDGFIAVLFGNGMTAGAIVAVAMMAFVELSRRRSRRLQVAMDDDTPARLNEFLTGFANRARYSPDVTERLLAAGEETLAILRQEDDDATRGQPRRLVVSARAETHGAEMEFATALDGENMEDRLAYLDGVPAIPDENEVSFRLLRHYASSVTHQKYHGVDIITVSVATAVQ